ncbi:MAG: hypothetical protein AB1449_00360 [Chloroflexota bacterium]
MGSRLDRPRALFLSPGGLFLPDDQVCSGAIPSQLKGKPCPFSDAGRIPPPVVLDEVSARRGLGVGQAGDRVPPCALQQLGRLRDWPSDTGLHYPPEIASLWLFKCRQMFLLVVPGLGNGRPKELSRGNKS